MAVALLGAIWASERQWHGGAGREADDAAAEVGCPPARRRSVATAGTAAATAAAAAPAATAPAAYAARSSGSKACFVFLALSACSSGGLRCSGHAGGPEGVDRRVRDGRSGAALIADSRYKRSSGRCGRCDPAPRRTPRCPLARLALGGSRAAARAAIAVLLAAAVGARARARLLRLWRLQEALQEQQRVRRQVQGQPGRHGTVHGYACGGEPGCTRCTATAAARVVDAIATRVCALLRHHMPRKAPEARWQDKLHALHRGCRH